jgi:hypothetical protein
MPNPLSPYTLYIVKSYRKTLDIEPLYVVSSLRL